MKPTSRGLLLALSLLLALALAPAAGAQEGQPPSALQITTEFPSIVIGIEESPSLALTLSTGTEPQIASLSVQDLPEGWTASFRGRGRVVRSVYLTPGEESSVDLRLEPPEDVEPGTYTLTVVAASEAVEASLSLEITVQEKAPASLAFDVDLPTLRGRPSTTFRYSTTLRNDGDEDLTVNLFAEGPPFFRVTFQSAGQEVTSLPLEANSSENIAVQAEPLLENIEAGRYAITLRADGGEVSASVDLVADVVGQPSLNLTTPDGRLSGEAFAGRDTSFTLLVQNTGSAPAQGIAMNSTPPSGWTVEFDPQTIDVLPAGQQQQVTAHLQPSEQALSGDYVVTFRAQPESGGAETINFRVTVRTSTLWGVTGIALVAVAVGVIAWAVMRFGRR